MSNFARMFFDNGIALARRLLAPVCTLCGDADDADGLCRACYASLSVLPAGRYPVCAAPSPLSEPCGRCLRKPPAFDRVACAFAYDFPITALIVGLKYHGGLAYARPLAAGLASALEQEPYPDLIMPMPISTARLATRGFNQAMELARLLAAEFGQEVSPRLAYRTRDSTPQALLPWKERARNVRGAFACAGDVQGKSVAVVDDVLTTGATLNELALELKKRGARQVIGWIAARTLPGV